MTDIKLYETGNGGDIKLTGKDLETIQGFGNMIYIALFGGNPGFVTPQNRKTAVQDFSWWGNSLLMPNDRSTQFNSLTEYALKTVSLSSGGRIQIEQAIIKDLEFMNDFATVKVSTQLTGVDRLKITIQLFQPDNQESTDFVYIWDGTRQDLQTKNTSPNIAIEVPTGTFIMLNKVGAGTGANGSTTASMDTRGAKLLVLALNGYGPSPTAVVSDNQGNLFLPLTKYMDAGNNVYERLYYCINPITSDTHTFSSSGLGSYSGVNAIAFNASLPVHYVKENGNTLEFAPNAIQTGEVEPENTNCLAVTGLSVLNTATYGIDSGFTITKSQAYNPGINLSNAMAYKIQPLKTPINPEWNWNNGSQCAAAIALFVSM